MPKLESLHAKHPDYRVDVESNPVRVQARLEGEVIADSTRTVHVRETAHEAVIYFPREDVRLELAERTAHETFCPFKGEASYWSFSAAGARGENVAWSYEDPFDEVAALKDYVAFYPDRVELASDPAD